MRHDRVVHLVPGSRHSRVTVIVAVARLATTLHLHRIVIAVARLTELILILTRVPGWMTLTSRVPFLSTMTATTTLVAALPLSTLFRHLLACLFWVIHLHLLVFTRIDTLSRVDIDMR